MHTQISKYQKKHKTNNYITHKSLKKNICLATTNDKKDLTIQRKVGFEFQTVGGKWNIKTRKNNKWVSLDHGETVLDDRSGFKLFNDFNDLEYVTSPQDANTFKDVNLLANQINSAANYHKKIIDKSLPNSTWKTCIIDNNTYFKKNIDGVNYYINPNGNKNAHPQATIGIKLEKLIKLADEWSKKESQQKTIYKTIGWGNYKKKKQKKALRESVAQTKKEKRLSEKGKGFLLLVTSYINGTKVTGETPNAKNAMPLMSRTDFVSLYKLLDQNDQQRLNQIIGIKNGRKDYFKDENPTLAKDNTSELKLADWWSKIIKDGADAEDTLQKYHGLSNTKNLEKDNHINSPTDIGKDENGNNMTGVLLEMRNLKRNVKPDDWADMAKAILNIVREINSN